MSYNHYGNELKSLLRQVPVPSRAWHKAGSQPQALRQPLLQNVLYIPSRLLIWLLVVFVSGAHRQP